MKGKIVHRLLSISLVSLFILIALFNSSFAIDQEVLDRADYLKKIFQVGEYKGVAVTLTEQEKSELPIKCGLPLILEAQALHNKYGKVVGLSDFFTRNYDDFESFHDSPSGHFRIHYTNLGTHQIDQDDNNTNGIPDYAENVALVADDVWDHHVNELGYPVPFSDGVLGGDSKYDIYIAKLSTEFYGFTQGEPAEFVDGQWKASSWIALQTLANYKNLPGYADRPFDAAKVTIAHEFFHAIHLTLDASEAQGVSQSRAWLEMSATWMEEETYDEINDYYNYLPEYIPEVHKTLTKFSSANDLFPYGASLFPIYLSERFGRDIIKEIWDYCAATPGYNFRDNALQDAIFAYTDGEYTFEDVYAEYGRWLYFTGSRGPSFFEEGANYPEIPESVTNIGPYIREYSNFPVTVSHNDNFFRPQPLGFNYVRFDVTTLVDSGLTIDEFIGVKQSQGEPIGWRISIMGHNRFSSVQPVWVADSIYRNNDIIAISNLEDFTDVVAVITPANPKNEIQNLFYFFDVLGGSRVVTQNNIRPPYPSNFVISDAFENYPSVRIDLDNDATAFLDVYTVAGEKVSSISGKGVKNGQIDLRWNGRNQDGQKVASGVYVFLVRVGDQTETFKVLARQ